MYDFPPLVFTCYSPTTSVTGFREISPLWQILEGLLNIRQKFEPTLTHFYDIWQIVIVVNGPKIDNMSSHLVTLRLLLTPDIQTE